LNGTVGVKLKIEEDSYIASADWNVMMLC